MAILHAAARAMRDRIEGVRSPGSTFSAVYQSGRWGSGGRDGFYSGDGSHDLDIVEPYVAAVRHAVRDLPKPIHAVDLGCGDFAVGSRLVGAFNNYTACDVVPSLVERNRSLFADSGAHFQLVDMVKDDLPPGDVVLVRQVFQHLSNAQIKVILPKLSTTYRYLIFTEHVPAGEYRPNVDQPMGGRTRIGRSGSGVDLLAAPFNLTPKQSTVLCEVPERQYPGTVIRTFMYELASA